MTEYDNNKWKKFWKKWSKSSEPEQIELIKNLTGIGKLNSTIINSYFRDLREFILDILQKEQISMIRKVQDENVDDDEWIRNSRKIMLLEEMKWRIEGKKI